MPIALTPNKMWDYTLKEDLNLPKEKRTCFKLKALNGAEIISVNNQVAFGDRIQAYLTFGLRGWENFVDEENNVIPFLKELAYCAAVNLNYLTWDQMLEISEAIRERNIITEEEAKNLPSEDA